MIRRVLLMNFGEQFKILHHRCEPASPPVMTCSMGGRVELIATLQPFIPAPANASKCCGAEVGHQAEN